MKLEYSRQIFEKYSNINFHENSSRGSRIVPYGWTDIHDEAYVYWTVHHLDSWIKIDQLDVTCFIISLFTAQHVSNVSTSIFRSLRLIVDLFHVLYCSGSMCVGVTVWFGWGGVVSLCRLKHCFSLHKDTTPLQPNHTVTPTHSVPEQ